MPADAAQTLFDFADPEHDWFVDNDGVMGGHSQGFIGLDGGTLTFTGELVTRDGGFTSARVERSVDLSNYDGVELRVRGGGRTFEMEVNDATRNREREVSRRAPFDTTEDWKTVRIPFADLESTAFGEPVDVGSLDRPGVESFGLFIADGIDGPFRLEVDWIRAY
ncbi:CIA30 family protein [Rubrivirga sp. IMCC43871]|uniref:CIA30 family protein n=1 Tax=Rubrivirga sp. IMCC43871 TaxID=3391575 RepID=UPI00398FC3BD